MRFGKKLALQVMEDQSGAPYLSHKPMKEAINRTVRELRLYQARVQATEQAWQDGGGVSATAASGNADAAAAGLVPATPAELAELEEKIASLDRQLFALVDEDLARIHQHVRKGEALLQTKLAGMQSHLTEAGLLVEESQLQRLEGILPVAVEDRSALCRQLIELRMQSDPAAAGKELQNLAAEHNSLVEFASQHSQYMEINVAGFRKLLKRHEKQIPQNFRSRGMPCLGFHRLVTHTSRQLLELTKQLNAILSDARGRFGEVVPAEAVTRTLMSLGGQWTELVELKGLGPECEMVLNIQRQLKDPLNSQLMQVAVSYSGPCPGFLYPKPGAPQPNQVKGGSQQEQHQQPSAQPSFEPAYMAEPVRSGGYPHPGQYANMPQFVSNSVGAHAKVDMVWPSYRGGRPNSEAVWRDGST